MNPKNYGIFYHLVEIRCFYYYSPNNDVFEYEYHFQKVGPGFAAPCRIIVLGIGWATKRMKPIE
jgi:hypothetical protein